MFVYERRTTNKKNEEKQFHDCLTKITGYCQQHREKEFSPDLACIVKLALLKVFSQVTQSHLHRLKRMKLLSNL